MKLIGIIILLVGLILGVKAYNADITKSEPDVVMQFLTRSPTTPKKRVDDPLLVDQRQTSLLVWGVVSLGGLALLAIGILRERRSVE